MKRKTIFWSIFIVMGILIGIYIYLYAYFAAEPRDYVNKNIPPGLLYQNWRDIPPQSQDAQWDDKTWLVFDKKSIEKYFNIREYKCKDENNNLYEPQIITYYGRSPYYKYFPLLSWTGGSSRSAIVCGKKYFIRTWWGDQAPTFDGPFDIIPNINSPVITVDLSNIVQ